MHSCERNRCRWSEKALYFTKLLPNVKGFLAVRARLRSVGPVCSGGSRIQHRLEERKRARKASHWLRMMSLKDLYCVFITAPPPFNIVQTHTQHTVHTPDTLLGTPVLRANHAFIQSVSHVGEVHVHIKNQQWGRNGRSVTSGTRHRMVQIQKKKHPVTSSSSAEMNFWWEIS